MIGKSDLRDGRGVFGTDATRVGAIDGTSEDNVQADGRQLPRSVIARIAPDRVFLKPRIGGAAAREQPRQHHPRRGEETTMNDRHPALEAARAALGEARDQLGTAADPRDTRALATTVGRLLLAVEAIVAYLDRPPGESDRATNSAVVDETMPPGGPHFDRARPHRGYGQD